MEDNMNGHSLRVLEFDSIKSILETHAYSPDAKEMVSRLEPKTNLEEITMSLRETSQARIYLESFDTLPLCEIKPIKETINNCTIGVAIQPKQALDLLATLKAATRIKDLLGRSQDRTPDLYELSKRIRPQPKLEQLIEETIDENGEVMDSASDRLSSIRVQMKLVYTRVQAKLGEIIKQSSYSRMIQDPIVTMREDRYVIPLKAEYKNHFPCIVHDTSASGQTLYVEPLSVIPLNNDLRNLKQREIEEIDTILRNLAKEISFKFADLEVMHQTISLLDFIFAKGELSLVWNGTEPVLEAGASFEIEDARHPLLKVEPIPISLSLGKKHRTIILTGPNTGGKTVTLKTIGLFILMAYSGLHLPAGRNTIIGMFDDIFVDIGDEQSISQNLSTFSSHLTNIINILGQATNSSLVIIDELGAGTDPQEGAALAYAITDYLHQKKIPSILTTHIGELKAFAYKNDRAVNASMGFDAETLQPTYHIYIGTPGSSHAFHIAQRLGLDRSIIDTAQSLVSSQDRNMTDIITQMSRDAETISREREEIEKVRDEADELRKKHEIELLELESSKKDMLERELSKAKRFLGEKIAEANEIVSKLAAATRQSKETDNLHKRLKELTTEITEQEKTVIENVEPVTIEGLVEIGDAVYVPKFKSQGVVIDSYPDKGKVLVQIGTARVQLFNEQVELIVSEPVHKNEATDIRPKLEVPIKLELFGLSVDEATAKLEKYLDSAYGEGVPFVYVVHGRGTGILRKAIHDYLSGHSRVDRFHAADAGQGGDAVTIVYIK
jgi:DNA mismatch repair protein MutS2